MQETPRKSPSAAPVAPDPGEGDQAVKPDGSALALPSHVAASGSLDRLVEIARDYARQAASENTLKAYAKDWAISRDGAGCVGRTPCPPLLS